MSGRTYRNDNKIYQMISNSKGIMVKKVHRIAVIILNYFDAEATITCIDSVRNRLQATIFLIDNSADAAEKSILTALFQKCFDIHLFFPPKNLGFAGGVNLGLSEAVCRGYYRFLLLNNDAIVLDGIQEKITIAYEKCKGGLIAPAIHWGDSINRGYYYHKYFGLITKERIFDSNGWFYYLSGCALAFDKDFIDNVGFLNEQFFMYGEDIELAFRAVRKNVAIELIPDVLVLHDGSRSSNIASFFYEYHLSRSHYLLCFIFFTNPLNITMAILAKTFTLMARAIVRSTRYKSLEPLKGFLLGPFSIRVRPSKK